MIREKMQEALEAKKNDYKSFIWKGKKVKTDEGFTQEEIKLVDATPDQLREFYTYCQTMLYNNSKTEPGRYNVLSMVQQQREYCNVELFLRSLGSANSQSPRFLLNEQIQNILRNSGLSSENLTLDQLAPDCLPEFAKLPLSSVIDGCLDKLGVFNRKHLTLTFILKQGVWLTPQEMNDLTEKETDGSTKNRLDVIRERLNINQNIKFRINSKGLTYTQLRAMLQLKSKKYSEITTEQLTVLRNRILFNLEDVVRYNINQWEERMEQIEIVAKKRGINL